MEINGKLCIDVKEAAKLLGIGTGNMYDLTHRADFPKICVGKRIIIPYERFVQWLNETAGEAL